MAGDVHGICSWPGATAIEGASYTVSHGISPGTANLRVQPQPNFPDEQGDLVFDDGYGKVIIPDCRLEDLKVERDDSGTFWSVVLADRRWRWRDLGTLSGWYNQLDPYGNLIPWTIRSPTELATLCLEAMGEVGYVLDLPPGLGNPGLLVDFFIKPSGVNPPVSWDGIPPAQALQQVADLFGCRVVYQLRTNTVLVGPMGVGASLPSGGTSIHKDGPSIKNAQVPDGVGVRGAPTRYQTRLSLEAVGEEWDGSYRPIAQLSYAPVLEGCVQISKVTIVCTGSSAVTFKVYLNAKPGEAATAGSLFDYPVTGGDTAAIVATALAAQINANDNARIKGVLTASAAFGVVTISGLVDGQSFSVAVAKTDAGSTPTDEITFATTQDAKPDGAAWDFSPPPLFPGVVATDRLTFREALALAQKSVWKFYRVTTLDASGEGPITVPGYGPISFPQQLVLQDTQVDQITPQPLDENLTDRLGRHVNVNFYNGYSKDKPAAVYGSVYQLKSYNVWFSGARALANSPEGSQVFVPLSIDPIWQLVKFSDHVYYFDRERFTEPDLVLQTAVLVRDEDTNQVACFERFMDLTDSPRGTMPRVGHYPDVQLNVTSTYDSANRITSVGILEADPILRADYYLRGLALQYQITGAVQREYNGILPVNCDGAIQQVSWSVGGDGASTTASRNSEHNIWVPTYAARRRAEFLAPAQQELLLDAMGRRWAWPTVERPRG